ncbi:extensin-like [Punica granatum]|nr:extensin-like [Punica granatum]
MATNMTEHMALLRGQNWASSSYTLPPRQRSMVDPNQVVPPTFVSDTKEAPMSAVTHIPPPPTPTAVSLPSIAFLSTDSTVHAPPPLAMPMQPPVYTVLPPTVPTTMSALAPAYTIEPFPFQASPPHLGFSYQAPPPLNIPPLSSTHLLKQPLPLHQQIFSPKWRMSRKGD